MAIDIATGEDRNPAKLVAITWDLVFSRDGDKLISTHGDGAILIWEVADRRPQARLGGHGATVRAVTFSPDNRWLATASEDHSILLWNLHSRKTDAILLAHTTRINALIFSPEGSLYSADQDGDLIRWHTERREPRWHSRFRSTDGLGLPRTIYGLSVSPDGRWAVASTGVVDASNGELIVDFEDRRPLLNPSGIYGLKFMPSGDQVAIATTTGEVHLLQVPDWQRVRSGSAGDVSLIAIDVSPDGRHLVTGEDEGTIRLWSLDPLEPIAVLGKHGSRVKSVAFSPDGALVAVDVRIVAATSQALASEVSLGRFHEALFYRLNVVHLLLPPLRERSEDIPALVEHFAALARARFGTKVRFPPEVTSWIAACRLPGNVRQLRNLVDRLFALSSGDHVRLTDVVPMAAELGADSAAPLGAIGSRHDALLSRPVSSFSELETRRQEIRARLGALRDQMIDRALEDHGGKVSAAASALKVDRRTLYKILRER